MAHAIGHIVLRHEFDNNVLCDNIDDVGRIKNGILDSNSEASYFASELLVKEELFNEYFYKYRDITIYDIDIIDEASNDFNVPRTIIMTKLDLLGYRFL